MKKQISILYILIMVVAANSQHITNTLGTGGIFSIKNGSSTFLSISQSNGNIDISSSLLLKSTTSNTEGIIYKDGASFIHNFGIANSCTFVGVLSGNLINPGLYNSGFGTYALNHNTTGKGNSAFGHNSMKNNTTGEYNSAFGESALLNNISGNQSSAFGSATLYKNMTGFYNNAFGYNSLFNNTTGNNNCAFGRTSLYNNTSGIFNTAIGSSSLFKNISGDNNTAIGGLSMWENTTGYSNTAVGYNTLTQNTNGAGNTCIGVNSLSENISGQLNTVLGYQAGTDIQSGSNVTLVGYNSEPTSSSVSNQITLGNNSVTSLRCNVTTITSLSDARDKKNIQDLSLGLDFISKLKPRIYNWDKREWYENNQSDGSKMQVAPTAGFIAQELDEIQTTQNAEWLNLVLKDNPEKWEATPGNLLPVMVKAIQELDIRCDSLQNENKLQAGKLEEMNDLKEKLLALTLQMEEIKIKTIELQKATNDNIYKENNLQLILNENSK